MGVSVLVSSQKFYNEFKNDVGFVSNLGDYTNNFTGVVMENVKVITEIDVNWSASVSAGDVWSYDAVNLKVVRASGNWQNDGFSIGDTCDWLQNGVVTANITITGISQDGSTIFFTLNSGAITDTNNAQLNGLSYLSALVYRFGLLGNSESFNVESKVSGNDQGYYGSNVGGNVVYPAVRNNNWVTLTKLGSYEDWRTGTMRIRFLSNPAPDVQRFEIEHTFTIIPFYLDGELSNLQNKVLPNLYNGLNTLKYVYNAGFRTVLSNPNTEKEVVVDNSLGSVAWFEENFNGFQNNYEVLGTTYTDLALNSADGLLIGSETIVTISVQRNNGNFVGGDRVGVYISQLPEQAEYTNIIPSNLKANFLYDNAINNEGLAATIGGEGLITDFIATSTGVNTMDLTFKVEYLPTQKAFLSGKNSQSPVYFMIGVELGDNTLTNGNSDRVILLADVDVYDESADIPNLIDFTKFDIYPHNQQIGIGAGFTDMVSWNEDGLVVDFQFNINLLLSPFINTLDFQLVAYNTVTQQYFVIDTYSYGVGTAIVSGGIQQLTENTTRGYILEAADQFNEVTLQTDNVVLDRQFYSGRFAQKVSWQDWISNLNADTIFYDGTKPQNNLNYKSSNYSELNNYEIRLAVFSNLDGVSTLGVSGNTNYLFLSPNIRVFDYEKDGVEPPVWSCEIETFDTVNNTNLGGAILTGQDTLFRTTWTNSNGAVTSLLNIWGINRIEETGQGGYDITEMSSLNEPAANQILIPNSGTKLFVYLNAGLVVFECLIDGSQISAGVNYNLSSRIQDDNVLIDGKITEDDILKDTETDVQKIIE